MRRAAGERGTGRRSWVDWLEQRLNLSELFSFVTHFGFVHTRVDASQPVREVVRRVASERVPSYATWPRVLGLLAAILFALEATTGLLLACYYRPTPETAFESTRTIVRDLPFGWFVHQIHAWGAYLLLAVVGLRLLRLFWDGLYRAPREVLWWSAVGMAWVVVQLDFSGRLLPMDVEAYWSTVRGLEVVYALPLLGPLLTFLLGGTVVNDDVHTRLYILHIVVLPGMFLALLYLTFATLRRVGLSPDEASAPLTTSYRDQMYAMVILVFLMFGVAVTLAALVPFPFLRAADPYSTPMGARPAWYLLAPYALLHAGGAPAWLTGGLWMVSSLVVLALPLLVRGAPAGRVRVFGAAGLAAWLALSVAGWLVERS